jgi:hypothetical protein
MIRPSAPAAIAFSTHGPRWAGTNNIDRIGFISVLQHSSAGVSPPDLADIDHLDIT